MIILWHHRDLRLEDNPALHYAASSKLPVLPLYIHDPEAEKPWEPGAASLCWLHHSLEDLRKRYQKAEASLCIRHGDSQNILEELLGAHPITEICWTERFQPKLHHRDQKLKRQLERQGIKVTILNGNYLTHPDAIKTKQGKPYQVFTPYSKAVLAQEDWGVPLPAPKFNSGPTLESDTLELLPRHPWAAKVMAHWQPGRNGAQKQLKALLKTKLADYSDGRDLMGQDLTSRLSPHLAFGEISPREIWHACEDHPDAAPYLRQLIWRDFANSMLHHFPYTSDRPLRTEFDRFPWKKDKKALQRWQKGQTGYPIVDAAMRQLWECGWMHNRARMIVASFLVKDLHIHWIEGARWFWDTLVDADLANNSFGWQWTAGCGADAAPYFRIFNPFLQSKKFDPNGDYIRQYVPELADLPSRQIHDPGEASGYPQPMVDHSQARDEALAAYHRCRGNS